MNPTVNFVELENRVISATYRNLMVKAKVVLVNKTSGNKYPIRRHDLRTRNCQLPGLAPVV
jgi:hypothetical protein